VANYSHIVKALPAASYKVQLCYVLLRETGILFRGLHTILLFITKKIILHATISDQLCLSVCLLVIRISAKLVCL